MSKTFEQKYGELCDRLYEAERDELRLAVGLATTIKGDMVMDAEHPLAMMQEVTAFVKELRQQNDELAAFEEPRDE